MTNAEWMIKNGYKFTDLLITYSKDYVYKISVCGKPITEYKATNEITCLEIILKWLDMEHQEPILDDAEREYLKMVLKPFHEAVQCVEKTKKGDKEYLFISFYNNGAFFFPDFDSGTMYSGMELDRKYSLDELGITYEEEKS